MVQNKSLKLQDKYVKVNSINTRYWQVGNSGSPVILLHGGGGYIESWQHNILELAQQHRVYAFDMVGAGRSGQLNVDYTFDFMAEFTRDFMQALDIAQASLVGASAGGGVALMLTLNFPELVDRLVLVDSLGLGKELNFPFQLATLPWVGRLFSSPSRWGVKMFSKLMVYDVKLITDEMVEAFYQMLMLPGVAAATFNVGRSTANIWGQFCQPIVDRLPTITAPTLIIWGRNDRVIPVIHAKNAAKIIPNACLEIMEKCGHASFAEHPQKFNQFVLKFLA